MKQEKTQKVFPSAALNPTEYLPGVSPEGSEVELAKAREMLKSGIAVENKPRKAEKPEEKT